VYNTARSEDPMEARTSATRHAQYDTLTEGKFDVPVPIRALRWRQHFHKITVLVHRRRFHR
jgi:hypothetical protein